MSDDRLKYGSMEAVAEAMARGSLPVDPCSCFAETLEDLSGAPEILDSEIRDDYAARLAERLSGYLALADVEALDMDVFYNGAVEAMRPVRLTLDENGERSVWLSTAVGIPELMERACAGASEEGKAEIRDGLILAAATGKRFEREVDGVLAKGEAVSKIKTAPAPTSGIRKLFAGAMLATYLFLVPNVSFGQTADISATPAFTESQQEPSGGPKKVLNTLNIFQTKKYAEQQKKLVPGNDGYMDSDDIQTFLDGLANKSLGEKLEAVNAMWNKIPYMSDKKNYGEDDHWASPSEVHAKNAADCEDYAIGKYLSLRKAGVDASDMRVLVGYTSSGEVHAVLAVWERDGGGNAKCHILDNMHAKVMSESEMTGKFLPRFSMNENFAWNHAVSKDYAEAAAKIFPAAYGKKDAKKTTVAKKKAPPPSFADNSALSGYQAMRM